MALFGLSFNSSSSIFSKYQEKNIFPPKITKVFKSIWSVLKPTLPFILSVYFVISVPLFILQEAGLSYKLIGQW